RPLFENPSAVIRNAAFCEIGGRVMVRTPQYKYAHYDDGSSELYDLEADPNEINNQAGKNAFKEIENELKARLLEHWLHNQAFQSRYVSAPQYWMRNALEADYKKQQTSGGDTKYRPLYSK
ncbi:MAG: sulfatase/phosphatase domain-containing protein, partial [Candidatus Latescibacterota bacterium]